MTEQYTPSVDEVRDRYADARVGIGEWTRFDESVRRAVEDALAEFDRMIAQVRAETLREARQALIADQINEYGIVLPDVNDAVDLLAERADRIEEEAKSHD